MLMKMIADLHIHSRFSMATSKEGTPENLDFWARKKGISLIGTGDFTHPVWREELKERLVSEGNAVSPQRCICKRRKPEVSEKSNTFCCLRGNRVLFIRKMERPEKYTM